MRAPDLLTFAEAAERCRCSIKTLRRAANAGKLTVTRLGSSARSDRLHPRDLNAYLQRSRVCQSTSAKMAPTSSPFGTPEYDIESLIGAGRIGTRGNTSRGSNAKPATLRVVSSRNG
jgi:excisionase family DNA binding protein